jgi:hypothetical protein
MQELRRVWIDYINQTLGNLLQKVCTEPKIYFLPFGIGYTQSQNAKMVKTLQFSDISVPSPGFGAMGLSFGLGNNFSLEEAEPVLLKAIELGCTFWDTAVSKETVILYSTDWED